MYWTANPILKDVFEAAEVMFLISFLLGGLGFHLYRGERGAL